MAASLLPTPLVSVEWLSQHLGVSWLKVIDASTYLPNAGRDARAEYVRGHIPGAVFCDIAWVSDDTAPYPHTIPPAHMFAERIGSLGVSSGDAIVVYDGSGQNFSAPRLWWMLRTFGHAQVAVLDGGIRKWIADGHALEAGEPEPLPALFNAQLNASRVRDMASMHANIESPREQVVDARSPGRFEATEPEPRVGVRGGHIPGSTNVHYASLVRDDGTLRSAEELRRIMSNAGLDLAEPIVASCGTGITACAVVLALDTLGARNVAVYDGSWTEWGSSPSTPVETGPA
jgi:thiosulfate/3-mercaptopyruvate sulfurtransferase